MGIHRSFARGRNRTRSGVCLVDDDDVFYLLFVLAETKIRSRVGAIPR